MFSGQDLVQTGTASDQIASECNQQRQQQSSDHSDEQHQNHDQENLSTNQQAPWQGGLSLEDLDDSWLQDFLPAAESQAQLDLTTLEPNLADLSSSNMASFGLPIPGNSPVGLPRRRSRYLRGGSLVSNPIFIPPSTTSGGSFMNPMQRWRDSPPEAEGVSLSSIESALSSLQQRSRSSTRGSHSSAGGRGRAASTTSFGSGTSRSSTSARSSPSQGNNNQALSTPGRVVKTRRRGTTTAHKREKHRRVFPCTFCCDHFTNKHDWARHERSLHLCVDKWTCTPQGGAVVSEATGRSHCAYCNMLDPTPHHLSTHNHEGCHAKSESHMFSRKDHLIQHLRLVHKLDTLPIIDEWKVRGPPVVSRCGLCNGEMLSWEERVEHLAQHFSRGLTMDDWKGDHGFEPSVAAQVINAIPPYLLGMESKAPIPFSVTNPSTQDQLSQIQQASEQTTQPQTTNAELDFPPNTSVGTTFTELLTLNLGRYAQEQMRLGVIPTDEMFQRESRRIIYGTSDPLDYTMADNDDWLSDFRSQYT